MNRHFGLMSLVSCLVSFTATASHVEETITLAKGWNAVYLESTPTNFICESFFANSPVTRVGCYQTDAYESTAQYASDGSAINQKPVSYLEWFADPSAASSLGLLLGGNCYVIYATNAWTHTFLGVPAQPRTVWRVANTSGEGFMNLAGVSAAPAASVTAAGYFGEGPFGPSGAAYQIGGTQEAAPTFLPMTLSGKSPKLQPGRAYALTSERADDWPGVIRVGGTGPLGVVDFETTARRTSLTVANASVTDRTFSLVCGESADASEVALTLSRLVRENPLDAGSWVAITNGTPWTLDLKAGESATVQLALDRANVTDTNKTYGSVIEVRDESGSQMRVRVPLAASADPGEDRATGLWIGSVLLDRVSQLPDGDPVAAQGTMKLTALLHVGDDGKVTLLPQVVVAADTNRLARLFTSMEKAREAGLADGARRITGGMMSLSNGDVTATRGFGEWMEFTYAVPEEARDNPFRHAWHPDHAKGIAFVNKVQFVWKEGMDRCAEAHLLDRNAGGLKGLDDPDGVTAGYVVWKIEGLAKKPVTTVGRFALQRIIIGKLEK